MEWRRALSAPGDSRRADIADPTEAVKTYLTDAVKPQFRFRTLESLYRDLIMPDRRLGGLRSYLRRKSACLRPAFDLGEDEG